MIYLSIYVSKFWLIGKLFDCYLKFEEEISKLFSSTIFHYIFQIQNDSFKFFWFHAYLIRTFDMNFWQN